MTEKQEEARGFQFPCDYAIKAMGHASPEFDLLVVELIRKHCSDIKEGAVTTKESRNGKYHSVTVMIKATSREQLDAIYDELTAHEKILMRL